MQLLTTDKHAKKLRQLSHPVQKFDQRVIDFSRELYDFMKNNNGVGISAIQVGKPMQIMCIDMSLATPEHCIICNPRIINRSREHVCDIEGCLSIPETRVEVARPTWVEIEYTSPWGDIRTTRLENMAARVFFHEWDHFRGVLIVDHQTE